MNRVLVAHLGYLTGLGSVAYGVYLLTGLAWAFIVVGVGLAGFFLLLFDVNRRPGVDNPAPVSARDVWRSQP